MSLPRFEYIAPKTIDEAISVLSEHKGDARVIAGGTDILVNMKNRILTPGYLVDIKEIQGLDYIKNGKGDLRIGVLTTLNSIEASDIVKKTYPVLAKAAGDVGAILHRYSGTIGGNICLDTRCKYYNQSRLWRRGRPVCYKLGGEKDNCLLFASAKGKANKCYSVYSGDTAPTLMALGANVKVVGPGGERVIPLGEVFTGDGKRPISLDSAEVLTEVIVPAPAPHSSASYLKLRWREAIDFPLVGVAANICLDSKDGACKAASVVIGAIASKPLEVTEAGDILAGKKVTDALIEEVGQAAFNKAKPLPNIGSCSREYRKEMAGVLTKRAISSAL
ncbi:MAG: xanthine dehydrogenase family protein subunit M, partial [Thermodesulfobacteriota bacterium]|nr:xanthine dehydrogenase family protein subunit M [Thermodesulfobacteriota bacterium]